MKARISTLAERITRFLADTVAHRTRTLVLITLVLAGVSLWIIASRQSLDSEVLNLLPPQFESVQGLKDFNSSFSQARQLVFGFLGAAGHADDVEVFRDHFVRELKKEPWIVRVFDKSPLETDGGLTDLQKLVPYLLLNLPPAEFREAMSELDSQRIEQRLSRLRSLLSGDSIRAQMEARLDPIGLFSKAIKPFADQRVMDNGSSLASKDGLFQIALAITNQPDLGPGECQALMEKVTGFRARVLAEWQGYKPKVMVTGRTAYVAEISRSMGHDGKLSSTLSILIVSGLFFVAFRRLFPLLGICIILLLSAAVTLAIGMLIFRDLNMIAIGFCSILVGIGVDFSFLLYARYLQERRSGADHSRAVFCSVRDVGAAILYVVLTTSIGFLALRFSASSGFAQLGTLVALGVAFAGLFSVLFLFMFFKPVKLQTHADFMLVGARKFVRQVFRRPRGILACSLIVLVTATIVALAPNIPLKFDTNPRSLEPKQSQASIARRTIAKQLRQESDPVTVQINANDPQEFHDRWEKLTRRLDEASRQGQLKYVSTPVALALSPRRFAENRDTLRTIDVEKVKSEFSASLQRNGFNLDAFHSTFATLDQLQAEKARTGIPEWSSLLPQKSRWWFLLERYFSDKPTKAVGFLQPAQPIKSLEDQRKIGELVHRVDPQAIVTGWTFTLFDLIPWAQGELVAFTASVAVLILLLLWIVFRKWSFWLVHSSALAFSMLGLVATLKTLHVSINLLNALAFPVVLAIGVDHGIQFLVVGRREGNLQENLANVLKPLSICGLTAIAGFAVLIPAQNPALSGLGTVCTIGVCWCLATTFLYIVPAFAWLQRREAKPNEPAVQQFGSSEVQEFRSSKR